MKLFQPLIPILALFLCAAEIPLPESDSEEEECQGYVLVPGDEPHDLEEDWERHYEEVVQDLLNDDDIANRDVRCGWLSRYL